MFDRMKIRESARSRIPLLRSLSGSVIGSRSKSRGPKQPQHEKDPTPPLPPRPSLPDEKPPPSRESKATDTTTPVTSTQPSIAVVDYDPRPSSPAPATPLPPSRHAPDSVVAPAMQLRKVWVKRPNASATRVEVNSDDLVDNLRDVILLKYANSLGRTIDSPDITLKIIARDQLNPTSGGHERVLGPEEPVGRTLDDHFPGGQTIEDALIIELAKGRTPRPSPRPGNHQVSYYIPEHYRPDDAARDYFPPMPAQSPHLVQTNHLPPHSMAVLTTGQLPPLPSPGGQSRRYGGRPKYGRQPTSSPTIIHSSQPNGALIEPKAQLTGQPAAPIPTPPAAASEQHKPSITPPNRVSSPHPGQRPKKKKAGSNRAAPSNASGDAPNPKPASASLLDGTVPPINVLIVEDNVINLKLLEAFMKRLKVRWKSAQDGKEAVEKWRQGGFHLVLMDIQLPVMNGLDATREIRRLEGVNGIGVFGGKNDSNGASEGDASGEHQQELKEEDKLGDKTGFKSPVIIVALTASSLQSDRHEALAAGCNDFLTKPVNFVWMERKVTEWGCMQALIDFDGWRKWKEYASAKEAAEDPVEREKREKEEKRKQKEALKAMFLKGPPSSKKEEKKEEKDNVGQVNGNQHSTPSTPKKESVGGGGSAGGNSVSKKRQGKRGSQGSVASQGKSQGDALGVVGEEDEK